MTFTGIEFCGQKIYFEATGNDKIDEAFETVFYDWVLKTAPLEMQRADVQIVLNWSKKK